MASTTQKTPRNTLIAISNPQLWVEATVYQKKKLNSRGIVKANKLSISWNSIYDFFLLIRTD